MELKHLRCFITVAEQVHVAQPALRLRTLETHYRLGMLGLRRTASDLLLFAGNRPLSPDAHASKML